MINTACIPANGRGIAEPEWPPTGEDLREAALQPRVMLTSGTPFAISTVPLPPDPCGGGQEQCW